MRSGRGKRLIITLTLGLLLLVSPALTAPSTQAADPDQALAPAVHQFLDGLTAAPIIVDKVSPRVFAKSYLLLDADTATVLANKNGYLPLPIASTTKMMTALVVRDLYELDEVVTIPAEIRQVPGSDIDLLVGEKITVHNLLRGLLVQSGNDAAFALAYHLTQNGDYLPFVNKMNEKAIKNNLKLTHYNDPAGLDDEIGRSTAFELATVARLVLRDPVLAKIVTIASTTITSVDGQLQHELKNSNRLIIPEESLYMSQVLGVKTGFTPVAGHCLVAAFQMDGRTLIGVVLNTDEYTITASAKEMKKLFSWAQTNLQIVTY